MLHFAEYLQAAISVTIEPSTISMASGVHGTAPEARVFRRAVVETHPTSVPSAATKIKFFICEYFSGQEALPQEGRAPLEPSAFLKVLGFAAGELVVGGDFGVGEFEFL